MLLLKAIRTAQTNYGENSHVVGELHLKITQNFDKYPGDMRARWNVVLPTEVAHEGLAGNGAWICP